MSASAVFSRIVSTSLFVLPPQMIGRYSKGMAAILLGLATPEEAVKMCEGGE